LPHCFEIYVNFNGPLQHYKTLSNHQHKLILFIENIVKTRKLGNNMYYMSYLFKKFLYNSYSNWQR
jgi:hypothetical protein